MKILVSSACTSGIILFLISASSAMSFVMAYSGIPAAISTGIMSISTNKYVILLLMNIILMVVWYVYGHYTCNPYFHTNLPAYRPEPWHDGYPVWCYADL